MGSVKKVPQIMQMEALECGAACLAMILAYYGRWEPLEKVRERCGVSRDGSKASNILKAARSYGLAAEGAAGDAAALREAGSFPCIVFWNFNHFVVLDGFKGNYAYLNDPARGEVKVPMEEFEESFTGVVLFFERADDFEEGGKKPSTLRYAMERLHGLGAAIAFVMLTAAITSLAGIANTSMGQVFMDRISNYKNQKELMRPQLLALNPDTVLNDSFQPQAMDFISTSGFLHIYDEGREADNHIEDFVPDFLWLLQEQAATSRDEYAIKAYSMNGTTYPTIQTALQQTIYSVMGGGMSGFIDKAGNITDNISTFSFWRFLPSPSNSIISFATIDFSMAGLYFDVIGEWKNKSGSEKATWTRNLWNALVKTGGVEKLSAEDKANLEKTSRRC